MASGRPVLDLTEAAVCFHRCEHGRYWMSITVEGADSALTIAMDRDEFEELLDAGCIVFLNIHDHVHTKLAVQSAPPVPHHHLN